MTPSIDDWFSITVSDDAMQAELQLAAWRQPDDAFEETTCAVDIAPDAVTGSIGDRLLAMGICHGVSDDTMQTAIAEWYAAGDAVSAVIAVGTPPVAGCDATMAVYCTRPILPPPTEATVQVHHREHAYCWNVARGTLLATKVPLRPPIPGMTVTGAVRPATEGKDCLVAISPAVHTMNDPGGTIRYVAACDAMVEEVSPTRLWLVTTVTIPGDVDYHTGNIEAFGSVVIAGTVKPHFVVKARGDVTVRDAVESAYVEAAGHVTVGGGVFGKWGDTEIRCGGNFSAHFVENATVTIGQSGEIAESVVNSRIYCQQGLSICQRRGAVRTSALVAGHSVIANVFGSVGEGQMQVRAGNNPQLWRRMARLENELRFYRRLLHKGAMPARRGGRGAKMARAQNFRLVKRKRLVEIMERLIQRRRRSVLDDLAAQTESPTVTAKQAVYPKMLVQIGPFSRQVEAPLPRGSFVLNMNQGTVEWRRA